MGRATLFAPLLLPGDPQAIKEMQLIEQSIILLLRLLLLLLSLAVVEHSYEIGCFAIILAALIVDRIVVPPNPVMDENLLLCSVLAGRVLSFYRSAGEPSSSPASDALLCTFPSLMALAILWHAKKPPKRLDWVVYCTFALFSLAAASTYATYEPIGVFAIRAVAYSLLSHMLYLNTYPEACLVHSRAFLACFGPLLIIHQQLACMFALCALFVLCRAPNPGDPDENRTPSEVI